MDYVYNNGELYHARSHKYIKREWHNGRWRYWYKKEDTKTSNNNSSYVISLSKSDSEKLYKIQNAQALAKKMYDRNVKLLAVVREEGNSNAEEFAKMQINAYGRDYAAYMQELGRMKKSLLANAKPTDMLDAINYQKAKRKKKSQKSKAGNISKPVTAGTALTAVGRSRKKYISNNKAKPIYIRK